MTIGTFYNPFSDRQDREPVSHCSQCGAELYMEDICYLNNSSVLCERCVSDTEQYTEMRGLELDAYFNHIYGGHA